MLVSLDVILKKFALDVDEDEKGKNLTEEERLQNMYKKKIKETFKKYRSKKISNIPLGMNPQIIRGFEP